jgi:two-component system, NtrC family, sensor kinase
VRPPPIDITKTRPIFILHLEDNALDAELISSRLVEEGLEFTVTRVQSRDMFLEILHGGEVDMILADYALPCFDGFSALTAARAYSSTLPFIFVTGTMGEEVAIDTIKHGATDYVLKQRLTRLVPAVRRALKEIQERGERDRLESIVMQSDKMAAMGQLAAGVAHELNNPLTGILGYAQILRDSDGLSEQQRKDVSFIEVQTVRCAGIVKNLLQFSRKKEPRKEALQIGSLLESTLQLAQHDLMTAGIEIHKDIPDSLPRVFGDGPQLQQAFLNLMINAKHAMAGRRPAQLTIQAQPENDGLLVRVKDSGCGIPKENLDKIFDLFFTTKPQNQGTGLGLSLVSSIVKEHGGTIHVESQEGVGTTFTVRLPNRAPQLN